MKEFIEKLIGRLEELRIDKSNYFGVLNIVAEKYDRANEMLDDAIEIAKELAEEYKSKTQADKIRSMSDEELAEFFSERDKIPNRYKCKEIEDWIKWLQSEA